MSFNKELCLRGDRLRNKLSVFVLRQRAWSDSETKKLLANQIKDIHVEGDPQFGSREQILVSVRFWKRSSDLESVHNLETGLGHKADRENSVCSL